MNFTHLSAMFMRKSVATLLLGCLASFVSVSIVHGQDATSEIWTGTLLVPKSPADDVKFEVNKANSTIIMIHMNTKYGPHAIEFGESQLKFPLDVGSDPVQCLVTLKKTVRVYEGSCGASFGLTMTPPVK